MIVFPGERNLRPDTALEAEIISPLSRRHLMRLAGVDLGTLAFGGGREWMARTIHLCPQRYAVNVCVDRTASRWRPFP
jgi:hypothetical protein